MCFRQRKKNRSPILFLANMPTKGFSEIWAHHIHGSHYLDYGLPHACSVRPARAPSLDVPCPCTEYRGVFASVRLYPARRPSGRLRLHRRAIPDRSKSLAPVFPALRLYAWYTLDPNEPFLDIRSKSLKNSESAELAVSARSKNAKILHPIPPYVI